MVARATDAHTKDETANFIVEVKVKALEGHTAKMGDVHTHYMDVKGRIRCYPVSIGKL